MKWYARPLRVSALQCNFEHGKTLEVADRWAAMGFNAEQLFHPMADLYSSLFDPEKHGEILSRYLKRAHGNGLRILLYLNVHILGPSAAEHRESWAQRNSDGSFVKLYDTYDACCVNSPWRDHFFSVIEALGSYDVDGVFLDGPVFLSGGCFCPACRKKYQEEEGRSQEKNADMSDFCRRSLHEFVRESRRRFRAHHPDSPFYINLDISSLWLPEALEFNDIVGTEGGFMFYGPPRQAYLWNPGFKARLLEALAPEKPRIIFMAADQKPWSWYMHAPAETRLCIASTVANGSGIWYGLHGSTELLDAPGGKAGGEMIRFLSDHERFYDSTESAARTGILFSLETDRRYVASREESDFYVRFQKGQTREFLGNYRGALQGTLDALIRSGIPCDFISDISLTADRLGRYDCVFLPTCACLSEPVVQAIRDYVRSGGNIISFLDTSLYTAEAVRRRDFGLADVFGVSFEGTATSYGTFNYFVPGQPHPLFEGCGIRFYPAPERALDIRATAGAAVLARFLRPLEGRYTALTGPDRPAIVLNSFGRGKSLYFSGAFGEMCSVYSPPEYRRILSNAAGMFSRKVVTVAGASGNIEVVVRKQESRRIVHLVNYAGLVPRPFEAVVPQKRIRVTLHADTPDFAPKECRMLSRGKSVRLKSSRNGWSVAVPELKEYEVLVFE